MRNDEVNDSFSAIEYLLLNNSNSESDEMLNMKLKTLEHKYGLIPTDDIAIIRLIN